MPDYKKLIDKRASTRRIMVHTKNGKKAAGKRFLLALGAAAIIAGLILGAGVILSSLESFNVKRLRVINAKQGPISNPESYFNLRQRGRLNLFNIDLRGIADDIQARHPELASVRIRKRLPDQLLVIIEERKPVAVIVSSPYYLCDSLGFILPYNREYISLPKIDGINRRNLRPYEKSDSLRLAEALGLLVDLQKAQVYPRYDIQRIDVGDYGDIVFYLANGTEVKVGQGEFARKAVLLKGILNQLEKDKSVPKYIDMRFGDPAVLT